MYKLYKGAFGVYPEEDRVLMDDTGERPRGAAMRAVLPRFPFWAPERCLYPVGNCVNHRTTSTVQLDSTKLFGSGSGHGPLFQKWEQMFL